MKKNRIIAFTLAIAIGGTAYKTIDNIISRLGMDEKYARGNIINNLVGNFSSGPMSLGVEGGDPNSTYAQSKAFKIPYSRNLASIISGDKVGAATELCEYVKNYVNSEEFVVDYKNARENALPLVDMGMSLGELKRSADVCRTNIKNYPNDTKYVAEQQQLLNGYQKRIDAMLEATKKPFEGKAAWEKMYPADPALVVKRRLQEYLALAATVDFSAQLTGTGKRQKFVNPAYEKKSLKWKAIFRAGKDVNAAVTAFVKEWLKGEIISSTKTKMAVEPAPVNNTSNNNTSNNGKSANNNGNNGTVTTTTTTETKEPQPEKKTDAKKIKQKIGSIFRN